jgi:hypothetical protein
MRALPWLILGLLGLFLLYWAGPALAYMPRITWTHPTQLTNGQPLPLSAITGTRIEYGTCTGSTWNSTAWGFTLLGTKRETWGPNVQPGQVWCYRLKTLTNRPENPDSDWTVPVRFVVPGGGCRGCHAS